MPYTTADTGAKVGFRPYYQTDPYGASHLSGFPAHSPGLGQQHPFKPQAWHLHGMGHYEMNRPFDPWELFEDTGAGLHGWGLGYLGSTPDPDTISALVAAGYDPGLVNTAVAMGATDEQLLALPYPDDPATESNAIMNLINQLGGASATPGASAASAGSYPSIVSSMISTNFGSMDLSQSSVWQSILGMMQSAFQQLTQLQQQFPGDSTVASAVAQYQSAASQFASAWQSVFGSTPSGLSGWGMGDVTTVIEGAGIIIGGVVMAATIGLPITLAVGGVLAALWTIKQFISTKQASLAVAQTQATTALTAAGSTSSTNAQLTAALAKAQASGDTTTANAIIATLAKTAAPVTPAPANAFETWLMNNAGTVAIGVGALLVLPTIASGLFGGKRR